MLGIGRLRASEGCAERFLLRARCSAHQQGHEQDGEATRPRRPFFDGWFARLTDQAAGLSLSVVLGLFWRARRRRGERRPAQEQYLCISARSPGQAGPVASFHSFPDPARASVSVRMAQPRTAAELELPLRQAAVWSAPATRRGRLRYESADAGWLEVGPGGLSCDLRAEAGRIRIASSGAARPWAPEGWLGRLGPLGALPCRYVVQTLHTPSRYAFEGPGADWRGEGSLHVETNFGESFPEGWLYAQGRGDDGAEVLIAGGRFSIGPVAPMTWLLRLRLPGLEPLEFRTTDLDSVRVGALSCCRLLQLEVRRPLLRGGRLRVSVRLSAPPSSFSSDGGLYVPTADGFSRSPGALESFAAVADIRVEGSREAVGTACHIQGCLLEFGGSFQDPSVCESMVT